MNNESKILESKRSTITYWGRIMLWLTHLNLSDDGEGGDDNGLVKPVFFDRGKKKQEYFNGPERVQQILKTSDDEVILYEEFKEEAVIATAMKQIDNNGYMNKHELNLTDLSVENSNMLGSLFQYKQASGHVKNVWSINKSFRRLGKLLAAIFVLLAASINSFADVGPLDKTGDQVVCIGSIEPYGVEDLSGGTSSFTWSINPADGGTISGTTNLIDVHWTKAGTYVLSLVEHNAQGCDGEVVSITVTVMPLPTATIAYSGSPYCASGTAVVSQTGQAGGTYHSTTGLIVDASTGTVDLVASTAGTYTVTYDFSNGTCSSTTEASITINALPTATIAYSGSPYCASGTAVALQTGQAGGTYHSTTGLIVDASTGTVDLVASTAGTYTVTYEFSNGTCSSTTETSITINALPTATIAYSGSPYCASGTAVVTQTGQAGGTYNSTTGLVVNASTGTVDLVASTAGTYTVTYDFSNGTCSSTTEASITINALPTATIAYSGSPYCASGTAVALQTGQAGGTYHSTTGLVVDASTGTVDLVASTAGTYTVTYEFSNGTCSSTTETSITINALPMATIAYSGSPYCASGTAVVLQTGQAGGTYHSTTGLVVNASTGTVDLVASTAGTYTVTYDFSNGTCSSTTEASITINALPTATIAYSGSPYCASGTAVALQTGQAGGTYHSTTGLVVDASTGTVDLVASTAGTYTVTYEFNDGTCSSTTETSITINALPTATIAYSGSPYCASGTAVVLQTGQTGGTYHSTTGLIVDASTGTVDLVASTAGTYTVTYEFSNGTCSNTTESSITINSIPVATIAYNGSPYCATGTATVTQTGQAGGTYHSITGLVIDALTGTVDLMASTVGTYTVTYDFSNGACTNTTETSITIKSLPDPTLNGPSPICESSISNIYQTDSGKTNYVWTVSTGGQVTAGGTASDGTVTVTWITPGDQSVTVNYTDQNGCSAAAAKAYNVVVTPLPKTSPIYHK